MLAWFQIQPAGVTSQVQGNPGHHYRFNTGISLGIAEEINHIITLHWGFIAMLEAF